MMRLLIITKRPEFDEKGCLVPGQCEPHSDGWELRLYAPPGDPASASARAAASAGREVIMEGSYDELRALQRDLRDKDVGEVRSHAAKLRKKRGKPPRPPKRPGKKGEPTQLIDAAELRTAIREKRSKK